MVHAMTRAEVVTPTISPHCIREGVPPTRKPVFKSCDVVPAFEAATQTIAPIESTITLDATPPLPSKRKITEVSRIVAIVIPEIGFEDEPNSPVMREETVAKKKPKTI